MLNDSKIAAYTAILQEELLLATGCTEPIAVAYCAAKLRGSERKLFCQKRAAPFFDKLSKASGRSRRLCAYFSLTLFRAVGRLPSSSRMHRRRSSPMFSGMPDSIQSNTPLSRPRA